MKSNALAESFNGLPKSVHLEERSKAELAMFSLARDEFRKFWQFHDISWETRLCLPKENRIEKMIRLADAIMVSRNILEKIEKKGKIDMDDFDPKLKEELRTLIPNGTVGDFVQILLHHIDMLEETRQSIIFSVSDARKAMSLNRKKPSFDIASIVLETLVEIREIHDPSKFPTMQSKLLTQEATEETIESCRLDVVEVILELCEKNDYPNILPIDGSREFIPQQILQYGRILDLCEWLAYKYSEVTKKEQVA